MAIEIHNEKLIFNIRILNKWPYVTIYDHMLFSYTDVFKYVYNCIMRYAYFDVDETLIFHYPKLGMKKIKIKNPISGKFHKVGIHQKHVDVLKLISNNGDPIVVWSAGGEAWARAVVDKLKLTKYVKYCLQKPDTIYDDQEPKYWMPMYPRWTKP